MTITYAEIVPPRALTTATVVYTGLALQTVRIQAMTYTNNSGGTVALTVNLIPSGGTLGSGNVLISAQPVAAGRPYLCPELINHTISPGDKLEVTATAGNIAVSGAIITAS